MTALPVETGPIDAQQRLDRLRLRLVDAAADLRPVPLPSLEDLATRVHAVAAELDAIMRELPLVVHVSRLEEGGLREQLAELDTQLAEGWVPSGSPVEDVVASLRQSLADTSKGS